MIIQRWMGKLHFVGKSSLMLVLPAAIRDRWSLSKGDQMCLYELKGVAVLIPLKLMPVRRQEEFLEYLAKFPQPTVH